MDHVAIMKKAWKLTEKILSGEKTIESRWYMSKIAPWNRIKKGETVYFKNAGEPITLKAEVEKVTQYPTLTPQVIKELLSRYGGKGDICITDLEKTYRLCQSKRYCMLIFLKKPEKVKPFKIDKKGYGNMSAWLCVENIDQIKVS